MNSHIHTDKYIFNASLIFFLTKVVQVQEVSLAFSDKKIEFYKVILTYIISHAAKG